ncbi:MAG: MFS transporter [Gammaproteobacteria bacterium]|nr:MFS transporter [Gammaproteobacteria bacterium]
MLNQNRIYLILGLILAGEAIFALPFHIARFFRPIMLEMFNLSATELGAAQGIYGIVAMLCYFPGGFIADRYPVHKLIALSLWMTALGGLFMATLPNYPELVLLYGFFGFTTIILFWGALIRATREWGGSHEQGLAFGILEGGRGLLAVVLATIAVLVFQYSFPMGYETATLVEKTKVFRIVIYGYTLVTALIGIYIWFAFSSFSKRKHELIIVKRWSNFSINIKEVFSYPSVWLQSLIVICAYVGYKGFDNYTLFAVDVYGYSEIEAAKLVTLGSWIRPFAAIAAGLLADRFHVVKMLSICFLMLLAADMYFAFSTPIHNISWIFIGNVLVTCIAIFGLRGLYFAIYEEVKMPIAITGSAVGLVSVIGFTPDVFVLFIAGLLMDNSPGLLGHQHFFMFLSSFAAIGLIASISLSRYIFSK